MSRIGKNPIPFDAKKVKIDLAGTMITVSGPNGQLGLDTRGHVKVRQEDGQLLVERHGDGQQDRAFHGLYQRLLVSMVTGVTEGFKKELQLVGVGYRAAMDGNSLVLTLGYSHEVRFPAPAGIKLAAPTPNSIVITGSDKQQVGQVAANIRSLRPPEPYKGKGIRYLNEQIRRKVGKTGA